MIEKSLPHSRQSEWMVIGVLLALEASVLLCSLSIYKGVFASSRTLAAGVASTLGFFVSVILLSRWYLTSQAEERRWCHLVVTMNLFAVCLIGLVGESIVRLNMVPNSQGSEVFETTLLPKEWPAVTAWNRRLLSESKQTVSYMVSDGLLGWTVAPSRTSHNGLYLSSEEGIRSLASGISLKERKRPYRMALVGDSFTFSLGVPFLSSWGAQLEEKLTSQLEVLNFGVDGYGIDQAYLRYHRDVKPLHPDIVLLGFIEHDLFRTMHVYPFIGLPLWERPFAKPRFALQQGKLQLLNVPLPNSSDLFKQPTVQALPFIEYEAGYAAEEWEWRWYHRSALIRYLISRFPRYPSMSSLVTETTAATVDVEILMRFVQEVEGDGAVPLLVYFPSRGDFLGWDRSLTGAVSQSLQEKKTSFVNLAPCMMQGEYRALFLEGDPHYSPEGNTRAAECLQSIVQEQLRRLGSVTGKKRGRGIDGVVVRGGG